MKNKPEFEVGTKSFKTFNEAIGHAAALSVSTGENVLVDVVVHDEHAASIWGGDDAVDLYQEDPERSVFERIQISATSLGGVA